MNIPPYSADIQPYSQPTDTANGYGMSRPHVEDGNPTRVKERKSSGPGPSKSILNGPERRLNCISYIDN